MEYTKMEDGDWKYPMPVKSEDFAEKYSGHLKVSDNPPHEMYWQEYGNPQGEPIMFVHGGPGGHCEPWHARLFDPKRYRIIMFDQRGCGESHPHIGKNIKGGLADNDTEHLIGDIEKLRIHLGLQSPKDETDPKKIFSKKMHMYGGSWGSTLAMAYAQEHPDHIQPGGLVLRGIFLCNKNDLEYFYQGNATHYDENTPLSEQKCEEQGAYRAYVSDGEYTIPHHLRDPRMAAAYAKAWHDYVTMIPKGERGDMIKAYHDRLNSETLSQEKKLEFARAWSVWEGTTSFLCHDTSPEGVARFTDPKFAVAFATIENEYFYRALRGQDSKLAHLMDPDNIAKLATLEPKIVHGMHDQVCTLASAHELKHALEAMGAKFDYEETVAGHAMSEKTTNAVLINYLDNLPKIWEQAIEGQGQSSWTERG